MKALSKKRLIDLLLALLLVVGLSMTAHAQTSELIVKAAGFEDDSGGALFAVVDTAEAYDDIGKNALSATREKIKNGQAQSAFYLPPGWYAVSVVHDQNNNAKLDKNFLGLPKEPYGFSNNPNSLGKPSFEEVKFKMDANPKVIEVKVQ